MTLFRIFIVAFLINNIILMRYLALCSYVGMTGDLRQSVGMGGAVAFVTVLATSATWPIYHFVLVPLGLEFLKILVFILVIAALVQLVEFYLRKSVPSLYSAMGIYLPLITTNCAILAVTFECVSNDYGFVESNVYAFAVSAGYLLAMVLLAGLRRRIRNSPVPSFLKGTPILFIATSLIAMAFSGFAGLAQ